MMLGVLSGPRSGVANKLRLNLVKKVKSCLRPTKYFIVLVACWFSSGADVLAVTRLETPVSPVDVTFRPGTLPYDE